MFSLIGKTTRDIRVILGSSPRTPTINATMAELVDALDLKSGRQ